MSSRTYRLWLAITIPLIVACFTIAWISADRALAVPLAPAYIGTVRIDVPLPPVRHVTWGHSDEIESVCGGYAACADVDHHVVYASLGIGRFAVAHELGHLENAEVWARRPWVYPVIMRRLGLKPGPWTTDETITDPTTGLRVLRERGGNSCSPQSCPNEVAADAYASCRLRMMPVHHDRRGRLVYRWQVGYGWAPRTNRQQRRMCQTLQNAAT